MLLSIMLLLAVLPLLQVPTQSPGNLEIILKGSSTSL